MVAPMPRAAAGGSRTHRTRCRACRRECVIPHNRSFCSDTCKAEFRRCRGIATRDRDLPDDVLERVLEESVRRECDPHHLRNEEDMAKKSKGSVVLRGDTFASRPSAGEQLEQMPDKADAVVGAGTTASPEQDPAEAKLRAQLGAPIMWDTSLRLDLVVAKRKKDQLPQSEHGVSFRRVGRDCHVIANDGKAAVRVVLAGDGHLVPEQGCVVTRKAMLAMVGAEDEQAMLWFTKGRVRIVVDGGTHQFRLLDVLPFQDGADKDFDSARGAAPRVQNCRINAAQLVRIQKALAVEWIELTQPRKGIVMVLPTGDVGHKLGALSLYSSSEEG